MKTKTIYQTPVRGAVRMAVELALDKSIRLQDEAAELARRATALRAEAAETVDAAIELVDDMPDGTVTRGRFLRVTEDGVLEVLELVEEDEASDG